MRPLLTSFSPITDDFFSRFLFLPRVVTIAISLSLTISLQSRKHFHKLKLTAQRANALFHSLHLPQRRRASVATGASIPAECCCCCRSLRRSFVRLCAVEVRLCARAYFTKFLHRLSVWTFCRRLRTRRCWQRRIRRRLHRLTHFAHFAPWRPCARSPASRCTVVFTFTFTLVVRAARGIRLADGG